MIKAKKIIVLSITTILMNSCLLKDGSVKSPCHQGAIANNLSSYSKTELFDFKRALESMSDLDSPQDGCRAALLGQVCLMIDRASKASDYFSQAAKKLPEFKDYFLMAKANAELRKQNFDSSFAITNALLRSGKFARFSHLHLRLKKILADIAVRRKDDLQIIKTHKNLLDNGYSENDALLFNLAQALARVGQHEEANAVYAKLLSSFPLSLGAKKAQQLKSLSQITLNLKETEKRFEKLIQRLAFDQVVKEADRLVSSNKLIDDDQRAKINAMAVRALMLNNKFEAGVKRSKSTAKQKNPNPKDLETHAWALAKAGRPISAANYYGKFLKAATDPEDKAKACFFHGFSYYEASLYSMAQFAWQGCNDSISDTTYFEDYLWYQSLSSLLSNNYSESTLMLNKLTNSFSNSNEIQKYQFFLGYNLYHLNQKREGDDILIKLANSDRPSYYMLLARQSLGFLDPKGVVLPADALSRAAKLTTDSDCKNALVLYNLGFTEEARDLIVHSSASLKEKAAMLQHIGFFHEVWKRSYLLNQRAMVANNALTINPSIRSDFPLPHQELVKEVSRKYNLSDSLLYAIMRTESGFLESAMSSRGALGLMQMMPFVAHDLAAKLSLNKFESAHLKDPKIAIRLGAVFLATLKKQFEDHHLIAAAYNAGPHKVRKWLDQFGHLPKVLFVERIPFKQTRDYVKKVLPSESLYHALSGRDLRLAL